MDKISVFNRLFWFSILCLGCGGWSVLSAQIVTMALDTAEIFIGAPATLSVSAERNVMDGQGKFTWPTFQDTLPGGLEILEKLPMDTVAVENDNGDNLIRITQKFIVTSWDSGYQAVPPIQLIWNEDTLISNPLLLQVNLSPIDETQSIIDYADIKRVEWTLGERLRQWLPWIIGFAAVVGLVLFVIKKLRNRPKKSIEAPSQGIPLEPAHIVALRALEIIQKDAIWKQGRVKEHHAGVSEVLRAYFERRFGFPAMERSTDEIIHQCSRLSLNEAAKEHFIEILRTTDLVKFAKWSPTSSDHIRVVELGIQFVESTTTDPTEA
ncbi:MAG: hypothetical protein ACO2XQ_03925 [Flavobacteriales bacterium]